MTTNTAHGQGDYCDVYLTHDSMSVRKAHNTGRNHLRNVVDYYQQIGHEKAQSVIDSITSSYAAEGQANPMLQPPGMGGMGGMGQGGFGAPPFGFPGRPGAIPPPFGMPPGALGAPNGRGMPMPPFPPNGMPHPGNLPFPPPFPPAGFPNAGSPMTGMPFPPPGQNGMPNFPFPPPNNMSPMGGPGGFQLPPVASSGPPGAGSSGPPGR